MTLTAIALSVTAAEALPIPRWTPMYPPTLIHRRPTASASPASATATRTPAVPSPTRPTATRRPTRTPLPMLALEAGPGIPGGLATVTLVLAHDAGARAVSADVDLRFDERLLRFELPVAMHCTLAPRLARTHSLGGTFTDERALALAIFARGISVAPLGDGALATCEFFVNPSAAGPIHVRVENATLAGPLGDRIRSTSAAAIIAVVTPTPPRSETQVPTPTATPPEPATPTEPPTATEEPAATPTTPAPLPSTCTGDCGGDEEVSINDLVRAINVGLGGLPVTACPAADRNGDAIVEVSELVAAVNAALAGCAAAE